MMKNIPVYKHTAAYAREHDELAAYRASNQVNVACKEAIEAVIRDHYRDNRLDTAAVDQVVQQFGYDRAFHIIWWIFRTVLGARPFGFFLASTRSTRPPSSRCL